MEKVMYATVKLVVKDTTDIDDITAETNYNFDNKDIISTEWINTEERS